MPDTQDENGFELKLVIYAEKHPPICVHFINNAFYFIAYGY